MLREDQAAHLLKKCESLVCRQLTKIRGELKKPEGRAAAIWELICLEAFVQIASLAHEPDHRSKPDLVLSIENADDLWVEIAYLYPRNWKNMRRSRDLCLWIYQQAAAFRIPEFKISVHTYGKAGIATGPACELPDQHEKKAVQRSAPFRTFFERIAAYPHIGFELVLAPYTVLLRYDPTASGPYVIGGGVVEESPANVREHALFRVLQEKLKQHDPPGPYVVCVGSDQSPALSQHSGSYGIGESDAVAKIFELPSGARISAVLAVSIEAPISIEEAREKIAVAHARLYQNPNAKSGLASEHFDALMQLNFNRWAFDYRLEKWESRNFEKFSRSNGFLTMGYSIEKNIEMTIPSTILVDCLAGRTTLKDHYPDSPGARLLKCIEEGWDVIGCSFEPEEIEKGFSSRVKLVLVPPPERVFRD